MLKFVVILALVITCVLGKVQERLGPRGHGMGPAFSRFHNVKPFDAETFDVCGILRSVYNINEQLECVVTEQSEDRKRAYSRIQQRIKGHKVYNSDVKVNVIKGSGDVIVSGQFYLQPSAETKLIVTLEQGVKAARKALAARLTEHYKITDPKTMDSDSFKHDVEESEMVYAAPYDALDIKNLKLCYKVKLEARYKGHPADVLVDAETEQIIAFRDYIYGADLDGKTKTSQYGTQRIKVSTYSSQYQAAQTSDRRITLYDCGQRDFGTCEAQTQQATRVTNQDKDSFGNQGSQDSYRMTPYYCAEQVWDQMKRIFKRESYDGKGSEIKIYAIRNAMDAKWLTKTTHGEAYFDINPDYNLVCCDIVAHEIAHGICHTTAAFKYNNVLESAALEEGFADILGVYLNQQITGVFNEWRMSSCKDTIVHRSLRDPNSVGYPDTYKGNFWKDTGSAHTNSQVIAYIFYLLTNGRQVYKENGEKINVVSIGKDSIFIFMDALKYYLTSQSDYSFCREAMISAAGDIYGSSSDEVNSVKDAFYATGIGSAATSYASSSDL